MWRESSSSGGFAAATGSGTGEDGGGRRGEFMEGEDLENDLWSALDALGCEIEAPLLSRLEELPLVHDPLDSGVDRVNSVSSRRTLFEVEPLPSPKNRPVRDELNQREQHETQQHHQQESRSRRMKREPVGENAESDLRLATPPSSSRVLLPPELSEQGAQGVGDYDDAFVELDDEQIASMERHFAALAAESIGSESSLPGTPREKVRAGNGTGAAVARKNRRKLSVARHSSAAALHWSSSPPAPPLSSTTSNPSSQATKSIEQGKGSSLVRALSAGDELANLRRSDANDDGESSPPNFAQSALHKSDSDRAALSSTSTPGAADALSYALAMKAGGAPLAWPMPPPASDANTEFLRQLVFQQHAMQQQQQRHQPLQPTQMSLDAFMTTPYQIPMFSHQHPPPNMNPYGQSMPLPPHVPMWPPPAGNPPPDVAAFAAAAAAQAAAAAAGVPRHAAGAAPPFVYGAAADPLATHAVARVPLAAVSAGASPNGAVSRARSDRGSRRGRIARSRSQSNAMLATGSTGGGSGGGGSSAAFRTQSGGASGPADKSSTCGSDVGAQQPSENGEPASPQQNQSSQLLSELLLTASSAGPDVPSLRAQQLAAYPASAQAFPTTDVYGTAAAASGAGAGAQQQAHSTSPPDSDPGSSRAMSVSPAPTVSAPGQTAASTGTASSGSASASASASASGSAEAGGGGGGERTEGGDLRSHYCHVCLRHSKTVRQVACSKLRLGHCRKVVCERCFAQFGWNWALACDESTAWLCPHCLGICPPRATCNVYKRTNREVQARKRTTRNLTSVASSGLCPSPKSQRRILPKTGSSVSLPGSPANGAAPRQSPRPPPSPVPFNFNSFELP
mmetsp:Transcript_3506/g.7599  ORF Transcript_3506/g.7599 Transcript_3506/m.7599 type:complete len:852 (-) Transcript_3506:131-2686(-)